MDFRIILSGYDYRDINESNSESDDDGPDLEVLGQGIPPLT
jgi:hypothetical protein